MKELTIVSGKGGTGKTSITAAFADLAADRVLVDADVDAANLFLAVPHTRVAKEPFMGGGIAEIDLSLCTQCGECRQRCQFHAISQDFVVDPVFCEGCGVCVHFCPVDAIRFEEQVNGERYRSETANGPMIHARLGIARENSGMLVSLLRQEAREVARETGTDLILVDGPPGIGCPVIASMTGSDAVLIVTEPSQSGMHDLLRVKELADRMSIPVAVCVNKADLNPEMTRSIQDVADHQGFLFAGEIPFDPAAARAMAEGTGFEGLDESRGWMAVKELWQRVSAFLAATMTRL